MPDYTVKADVDTMLRANDKAGIRSAIGVGQTDAPTFLAQTLTGQSLTGTQATSLVDLATTWLSTTGNPTAIKLNVTNTASGASSNLMDLQIDGISKVRTSKGAELKLASGGSFALTQIGQGITGNRCILLYDQGIPTIATGGRIAWSASAIDAGGGIDTYLERDAAGILAQRNGTAKQALRVYNTALSGAPEWAEFDWITSGGANTLRIGTNLSGTGAARPIEFVTGGVVRMSLNATDALFSGFIKSTSGIFNSGGSGFILGLDTNYNTGIRLQSFTDSILLIRNAAGTDLARVCLGGTTSAFPAIKRNGTGIHIVLADDSGFATLNCGTLTAAGPIATTGVQAISAGGNVIVGSGGSGRGVIFGGGTKSCIFGDTDGVLLLTNNAGTSFTRLELGTANLGISRGTGSPEGVVTALVGSLYIRTDGGVLSTLYVKESGAGNTGWVAK